MIKKSQFIIFNIFLVFCFSYSLAQEEKVLDVCGPPPKAKAHRRTGGESFPPLPLPVAPLRRTEKKRPPSPPVLLVKIKYGVNKQWLSDWSDDYGLLRHIKKTLNIQYKTSRLSLSSYVRKTPLISPKDYPILYITGHLSFSFDKKEVVSLRRYLESGGALILDCCCGRNEIRQSFTKLIGEMFPDRPLYKLPLDHPVYRTFHTIERVRMKIDKKYFQSEPVLYGIDIGSRTALFLSVYDLSCGWSGHTHNYGKRYSISDALKMGDNIIAYILSFYPVGGYLSVQRLYKSPKEKESSEFLIAQIKHSGYWDPSLSRLSNLLRELANSTSLEVSLRPKEITLTNSNLFTYPFLYMTGHGEFVLSDQECNNLRKYLSRGGFLLVDNRTGLKAFDTSFRHYIKNIFPDKKLTRISPTHPIYSTIHDIKSVKYTDHARLINASDLPYLEGISIGGNIVLVYSKYDLAWGWQNVVSYPIRLGIKYPDSIKLATNIVAYALTH